MWQFFPLICHFLCADVEISFEVNELEKAQALEEWTTVIDGAGFR